MNAAQVKILRAVIVMLSGLLPDEPGPMDDHEGGSANNCYGCVKDMAEACAREVCPKPVATPLYPNAKHRGGNAEDCQACDGTNPPYPFLCPGPE